jgi:hypothetical protein
VSRMIVSSFFWIRMRIKASLKNPVPDLNKNWEIIICSKDAMPWIRYLDTVLKGRGRSHSTWCGGGGGDSEICRGEVPLGHISCKGLAWGAEGLKPTMLEAPIKYATWFV